ncbi:unnamed protein product [Aphanomyces euteiches]|uniref:Uncharacterized protein n=1 Tax=Aphanomyces euteiches TaxID=100861 RepID=A0A6G0WQ82_9STRA|nr:hypothetical protein Ae201684_012832 [Aphanomyces euteiches]KAH9097737.1 hypothetical protein Ae201684P_001213 [Aphanomyces euteiches]KAH9145289.1 hypothetical protein AeRB84_010783 [Aphanomyces euteiches]
MSAADRALADFEEPLGGMPTKFEMHWNSQETGSPRVGSPTTTDEDFDEMSSPKKKLNRKQELEHLRAIVQRMERELHRLQKDQAAFGERQGQFAESNPWAQIATESRLARQQSQYENNRLKRALEEQLMLAEALETMLRKRPRVAALEDEQPAVSEWIFRLRGADTRVEEARVMTDSLLADLNHAFIRAKLIEAVPDVKTAKIIDVPAHDTLSIEIIRRWAMPYPYDVVAQAAWGVWTHTRHDNTPRSKLIESIDSDTRYIRLPVVNDTTHDCPIFGPKRSPVYMQGLYRRFVQANRIVIVGRGVMEDTLFPPPNGGHLAHSATWITIERLTDNSCVYKCFGQRYPPTFEGRIWTVDEMINGLATTMAEGTSRDLVSGLLSEYLLRAYLDVGHRIENAMSTWIQAHHH